MKTELVTTVSVQADPRVSADAGSNGADAVPMPGGPAADSRISGPEVAVAASRPSTTADFFLQPDDELSIVGGISREDGRPILDVVLTLISPGGQQVSCMASDLRGRYRIEAPVSGSYLLIASAHGCQPVAVNVVLGSVPQRMDLTLPSSGELSGAVPRVGGAVAGATVTTTTTHGEVGGAVITGSDGELVYRGVPPDTYAVVAVVKGMHPSAGTLAVPETGVVRDDAELEPMATPTDVEVSYAAPCGIDSQPAYGGADVRSH